jgi:uracil-DNA glycosylase
MMILNQDAPYTLRDETERARRRSMLREPHVSRLIGYADEIRLQSKEIREIPYFDPCDGGIGAKVLLLLEAPGGKAVGSGFISRNNPDPTARTMCELLSRAGLHRSDTLIWNIVPWYVGTGTRIRAARKSDISAALPHFPPLLDLLPSLQAIILVGRKAQSAKRQLAQLTNTRLFDSWHPSQQVMNRWPERRGEILNTFCEVAAFIESVK